MLKFKPRLPKLFAAVGPSSVDPGDIVEVYHQNSKSFGLVTFTTAFNTFDYISISGDLRQSSTKNVNFKLSGVYDAPTAKRQNRQLVADQLKNMVSNAQLKSPKLTPMLPVLYAKLCTLDKPRAVGFEYLCKLMKQAHFRELKLKTDQRALKVFDRASSRMAVYFAMNKSLGFVQMGNSPYTVISQQTMQSVFRVMRGLTKIELEHGALELARGGGAMGTVFKQFLGHFALFNDTRLKNAADRIISNCMELPPLQLLPWTKTALLPSTHQAEVTDDYMECTLFDSQTCAKLVKDYLHIFIPLVDDGESPLKTTNELNVVGRSLRLPDGTVSPLLNHTTHGFALNKPTKSLHLSVCVDFANNVLDLDTAHAGVCMCVPTTASTGDGLMRALRLVDPVISTHELDLPNSGLDVPAVHANSIAGRIAGRFMAARTLSAPFVIQPKKFLLETFSSTPGVHYRLNSDAYIPVSRPLDSAVCVLAQKLLTAKNPIPKVLYNGSPRPPLLQIMEQTMLPALELAPALELRSHRHSVLSELKSRGSYHFLKCTILEDSFGDCVDAFCHDLNITVKVHNTTKHLQRGEEIIATQIIELDPISGIFIVSM